MWVKFVNHVSVKRFSKIFGYSFLKNTILEFRFELLISSILSYSSNDTYDHKLRLKSLKPRLFGICKTILSKISNSDSVGVIYIWLIIWVCLGWLPGGELILCGGCGVCSRLDIIISIGVCSDSDSPRLLITTHRKTLINSSSTVSDKNQTYQISPALGNVSRPRLSVDNL